MANRYNYGFRWARAANGGKECPAPERYPVASGYTGAIQGGGASVQISVGDVVKRLATGYMAIAEGSEKTSYNPGTVDADIPFGVVVGVAPYYDGTVMTPGNALPAATTYGTNFARQSFIYVVPANAGTWSVAVNTTSASFDTYAEWLATAGQNIDMVNSNLPTTKAEPELDIATIADAVPLTQIWRVQNFDLAEDNKDYAALNFRLLVKANSWADAPNTVGV